MYTNINFVVSFAKTIVKTADNMDTNVWKDWIYTGAMLHLGISEDEIEVAELKQKNFLAPLPPNCRFISELSLFDANGQPLNHKYRAGKQRIYVDERSMPVSNGTNVIGTNVPVDVSNDPYNLIFGTNGGLVDKVLIRYFKYPVDQNDQPLIRQEDVYACALFIKLMQAMRDNGNRSEIQQYDQMWKQAADKAKADKRVASSLTADKQKTILRESMRLVPQFNLRLF
jgi:hypothetical protein